jgi:hypothetical protein
MTKLMLLCKTLAVLPALEGVDMPEAFKFPDEIEAKVEFDDGTDIEIEIEDDTPERDRGRKPLSHEVADPTDEEIESYSDKVKNRIKELTHARHDERRNKEAVLREKQELERLAQHLVEENKQLKTNVYKGQEAVIEGAKQKAAGELDTARRRLKEAQESYDNDAIIAAQEAVMDAKFRVEQIKNYRPAPLQEEENRVQTTQIQPEKAPPDEKTLRWQAKNQWFGQDGFEEYTSYALGLHKKLVQNGVDPRSEQYFEQIDARMRSTFPEVFSGSRRSTSGEAQRRPTTVVASASRSTSGGKVRLTTTQVALAKKFGLTPQQYAVQVAKLESQNG